MCVTVYIPLGTSDVNKERRELFSNMPLGTRHFGTCRCMVAIPFQTEWEANQISNEGNDNYSLVPAVDIEAHITFTTFEHDTKASLHTMSTWPLLLIT